MKSLPSRITLVALFVILSVGILLVFGTDFIASTQMRFYGVDFDFYYAGASSNVPSAEVYARWKGTIIECPFVFTGINDAELSFRRISDDMIPDIVWGNGQQEIIVGFLPGTDTSPPSFSLIRDSRGFWTAQDAEQGAAANP